MEERRKTNRRKKQVRNLHAYLTRRAPATRGRRKDEKKYGEPEDWFDRERRRGGARL